MEIFAIKRSAVEGLMAIPRRKIESKFETVFLAGSRQFADDISFAILIGCVANAIVGVFGWPQTEAVMMFGSEDDTFHSCLFASLCPLFAVKI